MTNTMRQNIITDVVCSCSIHILRHIPLCASSSGRLGHLKIPKLHVKKLSLPETFLHPLLFGLSEKLVPVLYLL